MTATIRGLGICAANVPREVLQLAPNWTPDEADPVHATPGTRLKLSHETRLITLTAGAV